MMVACGCTSFRTMTTEEARAELEAGDRIQVTKQDGVELDFKVVSLTDLAIVGETEVVTFTDILTVALEEFSLGKSLGLYFAFGLVGLVISYG